MPLAEAFVALAGIGFCFLILALNLKQLRFAHFPFFWCFFTDLVKSTVEKKTMENGIDNIEENFQLKW